MEPDGGGTRTGPSGTTVRTNKGGADLTPETWSVGVDWLEGIGGAGG